MSPTKAGTLIIVLLEEALTIDVEIAFPLSESVKVILNFLEKEV
jgi:hypothetical protein